VREDKQARIARLIQKSKDGEKQWALVSRKDSSKVLKWFGKKKPSEEAVAKEEKRVQYFKNVKGGLRVKATVGSLTEVPDYRLRQELRANHRRVITAQANPMTDFPKVPPKLWADAQNALIDYAYGRAIMLGEQYLATDSSREIEKQIKELKKLPEYYANRQPFTYNGVSYTFTDVQEGSHIELLEEDRGPFLEVRRNNKLWEVIPLNRLNDYADIFNEDVIGDIEKLEDNRYWYMRQRATVHAIIMLLKSAGYRAQGKDLVVQLNLDPQDWPYPDLNVPAGPSLHLSANPDPNESTRFLGAYSAGHRTAEVYGIDSQILEPHSWSTTQNVLHLGQGNKDPMSTLYHELMHWMQHAISGYSDKKEDWGGMPFTKDKLKHIYWWPSPDRTFPPEQLDDRESGYLKHNLRDVEFYPNLYSEVDYYLNSGRPDPKVWIEKSHRFDELKKYAPEKWALAVEVFERMIDDQVTFEMNPKEMLYRFRYEVWPKLARARAQTFAEVKRLTSLRDTFKINNQAELYKQHLINVYRTESFGAQVDMDPELFHKAFVGYIPGEGILMQDNFILRVIYEDDGSGQGGSVERVDRQTKRVIKLQDKLNPAETEAVFKDTLNSFLEDLSESLVRLDELMLEINPDAELPEDPLHLP
jgi:hypothetical protein